MPSVPVTVRCTIYCLLETVQDGTLASLLERFEASKGGLALRLATTLRSEEAVAWVDSIRDALGDQAPQHETRASEGRESSDESATAPGANRTDFATDKEWWEYVRKTRPR
jgi:hypothetical protein